jgi:hypothetical protein
MYLHAIVFAFVANASITDDDQNRTVTFEVDTNRSFHAILYQTFYRGVELLLANA